ncbi:MAG: DUF4446 family protein [Candidatus Doudnabacteria bacterium]|nr:DUF4446 family protein [Candidatus Doudnabacteria bacterium]
MNFNLSIFNLILIVLTLMGLGYCLWQITSLNRLRKSFFKSSDGLDLEQVIYSLSSSLQDGQRQQQALENALIELREKTSFAVQKVGLVRFNPFDDGGGNFSFCLALLDEHNSGVVITSMHGRQQNRIYTKKIDDGKSDSQLNDEELQAVKNAHYKN